MQSVKMRFTGHLRNMACVFLTDVAATTNIGKVRRDKATELLLGEGVNETPDEEVFSDTRSSLEVIRRLVQRSHSFARIVGSEIEKYAERLRSFVTADLSADKSASTYIQRLLAWRQDYGAALFVDQTEAQDRPNVLKRVLPSKHCFGIDSAKTGIVDYLQAIRSVIEERGWHPDECVGVFSSSAAIRAAYLLGLEEIIGYVDGQRSLLEGQFRAYGANQIATNWADVIWCLHASEREYPLPDALLDRLPRPPLIEAEYLLRGRGPSTSFHNPLTGYFSRKGP